jgi:hypothetical protein
VVWGAAVVMERWLSNALCCDRRLVLLEAFAKEKARLFCVSKKV